MLREVELAAKRWQEKVKQPTLENGMPTEPLSGSPAVTTLRETATKMHEGARVALAQHDASPTSDPRWLRISLWLEECAEKVEACAAGDAKETLDGICDSLYVDAGAAHRFGMDFSGAYMEVVRSNDSKQFNGDGRCRDKGPNYSPPQLEQFIKCNRIS